MYQLAKIFYNYPKTQKENLSLFNLLKKKLNKQTVVHNNFLSFIFTQNAKTYCDLKIDVQRDIEVMFSFLQSGEYYQPTPFFYGPGGWFGFTAINDLTVLEYLSLINNE